MDDCCDGAYLHENLLVRQLQSRLNACGERAEIADALHFVVGELDAEMLFETREHFKRLQTIDAELFEKIVGRRKRFSWHFEMFCCEVKNFFGRLVDGSHNLYRPGHTSRLNPFERARQFSPRRPNFVR